MAAPIIRVLSICTILGIITDCRRINQSDMAHYKQKVTEMFHHAYDGYIQYAYPYDELRPLTCDGHDTWGSYSLTLIDAFDMLVIMGNNTEFQRVADIVIDKMNFDNDINVSVFETNIRVVGGLLSAHLFSKQGGLPLEPGWPCSGPLLRMAEDVARRLLPAFDTPTGMPYGTVNLKYGVPKGETTITCTAGVGTFVVEFGALSRLTGDPIFEKVAMRAMHSLWRARSPLDLVGNHIDVSTGQWTALDAGIGGGVDSYFEYLVKGSIMFSNTELLEMFNTYQSAVETYLKKDDWYMWAHMTKGSVSLPIFTSLDCYWPGIQAMLGDIDKAMKTIHNFHQVWKQFGFLPEFYNIVKNEPHAGREGYPLRPELIEATMYLYQATKDPYLLQIGVDMIQSIEHTTRTSCGYATVKDVSTHELENRMESFFLAETVKYLYLLFDEDNFIHNTGDHGTVIDTPNGKCVIDTGSYIFNTEAHPIDTAAMYCCSAEKKEHDLELQEFQDNLDLLTLFDLNDKDVTSEGVRWSVYKKKNVTESKERDIANQIDDLQEQVRRFQVQSEGEHQRIVSIKGQTFTQKQHSKKDTKVVTIDAKHIPAQTSSVSVEEKSKEDSTTQDSGSLEKHEVKAEQQKVKIKIAMSGDDKKKSTIEVCKTDGSCEKVTSGDSGDIDANAEIDETLEDQHIDKSRNAKDSVKLNVEIPSAAGGPSVSETTNQQFHTIRYETSPARSTTSSNKFNDVLKLIKSFTDDYLASSGVKSVKTLHEKMKYYSLFHREKPEMMVCDAQPFYMRFSLMGEMFLTEN
ncbi:ER degradation-enhancing alpha-mannosidase-like protein 2 [Dreissena polymorpha]|uniref:alpha-1,2-Mannosidase n=1 Tax=Dreissena polymorpha TaxID=45954 RepID=A0A9D4MH54_DREPO|nr:ER degradation-enhancing alpha-mannosidase-like protein 2 [Dreissena polymorpha]KAH3877235.1 hypothetical protein DPMN_001097 [Dreissena polymorpha]